MPFLSSFSSPSSSRSASPAPPVDTYEPRPARIYDRVERVEKSIAELHRAQERAMALFEGYKDDHTGIEDRLDIITEFLGIHSPRVLRDKRQREAQERLDNLRDVPKPPPPTAAIPAFFSLGPPGSDSEDSDVPTLEHSDAESTESPLRKATRTLTTASERTLTPKIDDKKQRKDDSELRNQKRPENEEAKQEENPLKAPPMPDQEPRRGRSRMRESSPAASPASAPHSPKPSKHISFINLLPLHHKKSASASDLVATAQHASTSLASPEGSPNSSSSDLKAMGGTPAEERRSRSAINLRGLTEGMSHFHLGETDPKRMRTVDATLANTMVFGGLKKGKEGSEEGSS
ncbi:MAG: hypothetical protein Q9191_003316 [Dirinaria sp. TL-2023a]